MTERNLGDKRLVRTTYKGEGKNHWSVDVLIDTEI